MTDIESSLQGLRIALLEARMQGELASLIRRHGGEPYSVPAVREEASAKGPDVEGALDWLRSRTPREARLVVFLTGVGVEHFFKLAEARGRDGELLESLREATLVCRGPKPVAALKKRGLKAEVRAEDPFTTHELLVALAPLALEGRELLLLHYGERNTPLVEALQARGATVRELLLYEWQLPEDVEPLRRLVGEIIDGAVGAVAFTSQVQARNLMQVADQLQKREALLDALAHRTIVVAIGPTCAEALKELGAPVHVMPSPPKMGPMVQSLARYLDEHRAP